MSKCLWRSVPPNKWSGERTTCSRWIFDNIFRRLTVNTHNPNFTLDSSNSTRWSGIGRRHMNRIFRGRINPNNRAAWWLSSRMCLTIIGLQCQWLWNSIRNKSSLSLWYFFPINTTWICILSISQLWTGWWIRSLRWTPRTKGSLIAWYSCWTAEW